MTLKIDKHSITSANADQTNKQLHLVIKIRQIQLIMLPENRQTHSYIWFLRLDKHTSKEYTQDQNKSTATLGN